MKKPESAQSEELWTFSSGGSISFTPVKEDDDAKEFFERMESVIEITEL